MFLGQFTLILYNLLLTICCCVKDNIIFTKFVRILIYHNQGCYNECKIKEGDVAIIHDDKKSRGLWSVAKVEEALLSKEHKVRGPTIKYFINGKTVVINRPINKLYLIEPMKQTSANIQSKFVDETKICQIETTKDTLVFYTVVVYMYNISCPGGRMLFFITPYLLLQVLESRPPNAIGKNMFRFTLN